MIDVATIDRQITFLRREVERLRGMQPQWAQDKAAQFESIMETLRQVRQQKQMTGLDGRRIW